MKPQEFKEQNCVYAKDQPEYQPLPALKTNDYMGTVVCCWGLSFKERVKVLFTGKIWVGLATFNKPLTPSYLTIDKNELITK